MTSLNPELSEDTLDQVPADQEQEDSIRQKQEVSNYIEEIDYEFMNDFRALLKHYINLLSTDVTEIASGLNLSRPVVTSFLDGKRKDLPLSVGSIRHLHRTLTEMGKVGGKRIKNRRGETEDSSEINAQKKSIKKVRDEAEAARQKLKSDGPDQLLITAGFQPHKMKMVPVYPQQYSQLSFISYLYEERPLSQDLFFQITQRELDRRELEQIKPIINKESKGKEKTNEEDIPLQQLKQISWMSIRLKDDIERKYDKAIKKIRRNLTPHERFGLLTSVLQNHLNINKEINFNLKVIRVERIPLSLTWDTTRTKEFDQLWKRIKILGDKCEKLLMPNDSNVNNYPMHQLTRTIVTCTHGANLEEIIFEYISTGTHVRTAISAILLNMGLFNFMPTIKLDIKCFEENIATLVKALVVLKNDCELGESSLGEWVSDDMLQAILQATVVASKKWLRQKINSDPNLVDSYQKNVKKMARLRSDFHKYRVIFDEYDFNDGIFNINKFTEIGKDAEECIANVESLKLEYQKNEINKIWDNLIPDFYRISIGSQIYQLTHQNFKFNRDSCKSMVDKIDRKFSETNGKSSEISKILIPSKISLEAEKIVYNMAFGEPVADSQLQMESFGKTIDLLKEDNILSCLIKMDETIEKYVEQYIDKNRPYSDPGYDIHYSLGSYYSITGKLLLYRGLDSKDIDSACDRYLKAIYFFHRIGLTRKVERNLTLAGRVKVRSKKETYVEQCQKLSEVILRENQSRVNAPENKDFELSMRSRLNSLKGEYNFIIKENNQESLSHCLQALRGSLWLGSNRHIADNLYTISRCTKNLQNREIKLDLKKDFSSLWLKNKLDDGIYKMFIHAPTENKVAKETVLMLYEIRKKADVSECWSDVWEIFREASANIWTTCYRTATGEKEGEHPFAVEIRKGSFLAAIESSNRLE